MSSAVGYDPVTRIVEVVYAGRVTREDVKRASSERIRLQRQHGSLRILADCSRIDHVAVGNLDLHNLPAQLYDSMKVDRETSLALLQPGPKEAMEAVRFYESSCVNRGWIVRTFEDRDEAINWLLEKRPPNNTDAGDGR